MTIVYAIIIFCILIFVHEFGHFITAKALGVKVNEFALGMGPAIFHKQKGDTKYSLRILPIGGYCAMEGEDEESDDERAFNKKPAWAKSIIVVAGAFMNVVLAIIVFAIIAMSSGMPTTTVDAVTENSPAYEAGIVQGDKLISIDGSPINEWTDILSSVGGTEKENIDVTLERDGQEMTIQSGVTKAEDGRTIIGITPSVSRNPLKALVYGAEASWKMTVSMVDILKQLFTGGVPVSDLTGPVGIVHAVGDTAKYGFVYLGYLTALISLNLAIVNMLPFPALDGGRLVFIIIRRFTGRAITDDIEAKVHLVGIMLLFGLMIYVTWNDIIRFIVPIFGG